MDQIVQDNPINRKDIMTQTKTNTDASEFKIIDDEKNTPTLEEAQAFVCLLYTSPSPRDKRQSRMPSSA